ncbi:hypothetical protein [Clostridium perfringens]|uniref:hypothetical protein n=1 Tax=Clostridium perfringens TaxID=1502 RepID=UPI002448F684|nr:hypothetical protein [Clostridium perfringens]MDH2340578.1 hypothetical protein [Clostridium perfringens]
MFYDYDIENMELEEMNPIAGLESIDNTIAKIKNDLANTDSLEVKELGIELLEDNLEGFNGYKKKYGGDCLTGYCCGDNPERFVGYIFVRENKIIDIVPYM